MATRKIIPKRNSNPVPYVNVKSNINFTLFAIFKLFLSEYEQPS
jgi:hypothetical protein